MQRKYRVNRNMKDDRGYHNPGDIVLMDDDQAAPLLAIGCIEPTVEDITPAAEHTQVPDGFPVHTTPPPTPPVNEQTPPAVNTEVNPPASTPPVPPQNTPANPSPEQINKDMEQVA